MPTNSPRVAAMRAAIAPLLRLTDRADGSRADVHADTFSAAQVEAAVRRAQRGEIMYPQFTRQARAAGCVGYFVQITGKCVQYFGRYGEVQTEWFPGAKQQ